MQNGVCYPAVLCTGVMTKLKLAVKKSGPKGYTSLSASPVCWKGLGKGRLIGTATRDGQPWGASDAGGEGRSAAPRGEVAQASLGPQPQLAV